MYDRANRIKDQIVAWRRDFHMHPEPSFRETRTAAVVARELERLGGRVRTGVGGTGVVAEYGQGQPVVAIRADMDALPIQEANDVPYASQVQGVMHACGHDAHIAMALGAATLLSEVHHPGTVRFLFQPAEERTDDEGWHGAERMVQDGALVGVSAALALHVDASSPVGKIKVSAGPVTAGADAFRATLLGKGGHAAFPHKAIDPVYIAGHVILALHSITSRQLAPEATAVIGIGAIHAGEAPNVIPERLEMCGTIRYLDPAVQVRIHSHVESALKLSQSIGGDYELVIEKGLLPTINDARMAELVQSVATDLLGPGCLKEPEYGMAGEDFSFIAARVPSAWFSLGCGIESDVRFHHHPRFDIDERCLPMGTAILAETALRFLTGGVVTACQSGGTGSDG